MDVPTLFRAGALRFNPSVVLNCAPPGVYLFGGTRPENVNGYRPNHQGAGPTNVEARVRFTGAVHERVVRDVTHKARQHPLIGRVV